MFLFMFSLLAWSAQLAGVTLPNTSELGGQTLKLNGIGLREKFWIDIYVAGLYLPNYERDASTIITQDTPKKLALEFIYSSVPKEKMQATLEENLKDNPQIGPQARQQMRNCYGWFQNFTKGDTFVFSYIPNQGTSLYINGQKKGTIPGKEFMEAVFTIYLGPKPADKTLRKALLKGAQP